MNKRYAALENNLPLLKESRHGLEIETLRIDSEGRISQKDHPKPLGAKLTHPHISTDFGEAQLELIAPPLKREAALVSYIEKLKAFIHLKNPDELLWPFSAPCSLKAPEEVRIARFGSSNAGWEKEVYREGLSNRFDRRMQALSGVHYNFSLAPAFWEVLGDPSEGYLHIVRNFMRHGWLLTYLFGASPYLENVSAPFATSLRMSEYGYFSKVQQQMRISFNSLEKYLEDLSLALETPSLDFLKIGTYEGGKWKQLNPNILQIEAEHYSRIRPKPSKESPLRPLHSLQKEGIAYVEVRALDLQPFANGSISAECLRFLHAFLLFCLIEESPPLSIEEELKLAAQENRIALEGRSPAMRPFVAEGVKILDKVQEAAALLDRAWGESNYKKSVEAQRPLIGDPEKTPSARIVRERGENSFQEYALQKARGMKFVTLTPKEIHRFEQMAQKSWEALEELEWRDDFILPGFEDLHPSTQCLLREAMRRGVSIETLDHKAHFFRLRRGAVTEDIKDANMTAKDNLISYFKMENKAVTKTLLEQAGIKTPQGRLFYTPEEALANTNSRFKLVVKPNRMNYGLGIFFVEPNDVASYERAIVEAFKHGQEVVVEEFCEGEEYRFLVINGKCEAVCKRIPANVVGDGTSSIKQLIQLKNHDPKKYKIPRYRLKLGKEEKRFLAGQGLDGDFVPEKGQRIWLRTNSNVSTGGDCIDFTDVAHIDYQTIAVRAAEAMDAVFCGIDMLIPEISLPADKGGYAVIECNFNPALWIHRYPTEGTKRYVERATLDVLGFPAS